MADTTIQNYILSKWFKHFIEEDAGALKDFVFPFQEAIQTDLDSLKKLLDKKKIITIIV